MDQTRQQHAINTAPTRNVPDMHDRATDLHVRDTDKHGRTRHLHGPSRTLSTTTRTNKISIRTKSDLRRIDNNLYKSRLIFGDSIIQQSNIEGVNSYTYIERQNST
ncbi:hypothetical protein DPMN_087650 [Dreissena polymorpha]|uniref:Uncharacterized protein n=1 Tax=Dreissena polymorpha TaxID=45954 RepID=A0A9D4QX38_DREPO|nr:hypothetical protein DPMN_153450 [Dreissena polymorpha]KAH3845370.1 hypothetical protein DPMN_087650 [Dreissena polymorpha]